MMAGGKWLPHPILSLALAALWLLLNNTAAPGHVLLGVVLGLALPLVIRRFWSGRMTVHRPAALFRLLPVVLVDIVTANLAVAALILNPVRTPQPRFLRFPLELEDRYAIALLAGIITLSPGTVSAELSPDRRYLLIHGLNIPDEQAAVAHIKARYEAPLKEAFGC